MINRPTIFEACIITSNEDTKRNAKCRNSHFEPLFGDLGVMHRVHVASFQLRSHSVIQPMPYMGRLGEYNMIRYDIFMCAQKLTIWLA